MTSATQASFDKIKTFGAREMKQAYKTDSELAKQNENSSKYTETSKLRDDGLFSQFFALRGSILKVNHNKNAIENVSATLDTQMSCFAETLPNLIEDIKNTFQTYNTGSKININLTCSNYLEQLAHIINTNFNGQYLFGGKTKDVPPIQDIKEFTEKTNIIDGKVTSSYTQAIASDNETVIGSDNTIKIDINADDEIFQLIAGALHKMKDQEPGSPIRYEALEILNEATDKISNKINRIGFNQKTVERAETYNLNEEIRLLQEYEDKYTLNPLEIKALSLENKMQMHVLSELLKARNNMPSLINAL